MGSVRPLDYIGIISGAKSRLHLDYTRGRAGPENLDSDTCVLQILVVRMRAGTVLAASCQLWFTQV